MSVRKRAPQSDAIVDVDDRVLRAWPLPQPDDEGDKEARGRVLVIGGSPALAGAVVLAGIAALRAGAGKLAIATARSVAASLVPVLPEARVVALDETAEGGLDLDERLLERRYDAILVGPGMEDEGATLVLTRTVLAASKGVPVVLDAAAMDVVGASGVGSAGALVTPHAGELARLTGRDKAEVVDDPVGAARCAARAWNVVVALKGATTIVATPEGRGWRHDGGNIGLAVSGSGDALAGIVAGLVARGASLEQAAVWGVALHARAGDRLAARGGALGFLAREIAAEIPPLMHELSAT